MTAYCVKAYLIITDYLHTILITHPDFFYFGAIHVDYLLTGLVNYRFKQCLSTYSVEIFESPVY